MREGGRRDNASVENSIMCACCQGTQTTQVKRHRAPQSTPRDRSYAGTQGGPNPRTHDKHPTGLHASAVPNASCERPAHSACHLRLHATKQAHLGPDQQTSIHLSWLGIGVATNRQKGHATYARGESVCTTLGCMHCDVARTRKPIEGRRSKLHMVGLKCWNRFTLGKTQGRFLRIA
jgi:hypothetical protein